jgi:hypothetical protein
LRLACCTCILLASWDVIKHSGGLVDSSSVGEEAERLRPWSYPGFWVVVLLLGLQVGLIWSVPEIPTVDGPAHKYSAWLYSHLGEENTSELARFFKRREGWVFPNAAYPFFLVGSSRWLTLDQSEKLAGTLYLLALAAGFRFFFVSLGGQGWTSEILLLVLALNWLFFMGFVSFLWGVAWALAALALTNRMLKQPGVALAVLANLALLLAYWSHLVSFALALISVMVLSAFQGRRRFVLGCTTWLPATTIIALLSRTVASSLSGWQYRDAVWERLWRVTSMRVATSFGGIEVSLAATLGLLLLAVAILVVVRKSNGRRLMPLLSLSLVMLTLALIVPRGVGSGFFIDDRVAFFWWLTVFAILGFSTPMVARIVAAASVVFCVAQAVHLVEVFGEFEEQRASFVEGAEQLPSGTEAFAYSFLRERNAGIVQPFANPNARLALFTRRPSYYHYQADPRHCGVFLICYTDEGESRYVGEHTFAGIHPSNLVGFIDSVMVWGRSQKVELQLRNIYDFQQVFENPHLRIFQSAEIPLEAELAKLARFPDSEQRQALVESIVAGKGVDRRVLHTDRVVLANAYYDNWTRGTRPAALVISNPETDPWVPVLKVRGPPAGHHPSMTLFIEDGARTESFVFSRRSRRITLPPVAPGSRKLFTLWTDQCWYLEKGNAPRCLGVRLVKVSE